MKRTTSYREVPCHDDDSVLPASWTSTLGPLRPGNPGKARTPHPPSVRSLRAKCSARSGAGNVGHRARGIRSTAIWLMTATYGRSLLEASAADPEDGVIDVLDRVEDGLRDAHHVGDGRLTERQVLAGGVHVRAGPRDRGAGADLDRRRVLLLHGLVPLGGLV